ncbi:MAG TPA: preprotein translocase subunit YajC [Azospirillaceae bacterium]|nr:preprotein translocase subunit YajC [Azospirillaceae bacterium]
MFISTAYAQAASGTAPAGLDQLMQFAPLVLIFVVFYFLLIRPQQKRMKEHKALLESLRRGDRVVTGGGIIGTVTKVGTDDEIQVEIADGVKVRVLRGTITQILAKTEPTKSDGAKAEEEASATKTDGEGGQAKSLGKIFSRK